ncbi:MAG TPA: hypothetical protein VJ529_02570, partial [Candidatus Bathyarchaeia archaeon]|nr:hypothetical protein [Candidatus Bathyarchaeia archaeon]
PEDIKFLASEEYFEPYFIIGGKYVLDYCKKHMIEAEVDKKTTRLFVAGQEFNSKESDPKTRRRVVEMTGEEHVHYEKQGYYVLDRMSREISPERLPISPFVVREKSSDLNYLFKRMHISDETQIDFLKTKIARRPADVAEIIREIFDITDRTIAYYPMYLLTFESAKKRKEATVTIDGITGEMVLNGTRNLGVNTILTSRQVLAPQITERIVREEVQPAPQIESIPDVVPSVVKDEVKVSPKEAQITESRLFQPVVCKEARLEPVLDVVPAVAKNEMEVSQKEDEVIESKHFEPVVCEEVPAEPVAEVVPPVAEDGVDNGSKDRHIDQPAQPKETTSSEQEQTEPVYILPPGATDDTLKVPREEETIQTIQPDDNERTILGFPARILGKVVEIDDNVTTVDGDVEIPSGTNINKDLVVKGSLKIGDNCRGHAKLKAFKGITIGADTIIDGDLISGGNIFVGPRSLINGVVEASGVFEIEKDAVVEAVSS